MIKATAWNGRDLKGTWQFTLKIDGVRALRTSEGMWMSRANKPLYNIPIPVGPLGHLRDCEVYLGNFRDTIRAIRTKKLKPDTPLIKPEHLYSLDPLDCRLQGGTVHSPTAAVIRETMESAVRQGYEGLVMRQCVPGAGFVQKWLKVKPQETHDVLITGAVEGEGKHKGRLGALLTAKGDVGTGFTDKERERLWTFHTRVRHLRDDTLIGQTIEVACMHFTPDGKFRHPRFVRMRPDKTAEA